MDTAMELGEWKGRRGDVGEEGAEGLGDHDAWTVVVSDLRS
jgi:hypothetical protein